MKGKEVNPGKARSMEKNIKGAEFYTDNFIERVKRGRLPVDIYGILGILFIYSV
jgi:hypothetical protein